MSVIRPQFGSNKAENLASVKALLKAQPRHAPEVYGTLPTGFEPLDKQCGGLIKGTITEIVSSVAGGSLFLEQLLNTLSQQKCCGALIDPTNSFDPDDVNSDSLQRLLWITCKDVKQAIKTADLLLRDGNLQIIIIDLHRLTSRDLKFVDAATWHRFQKLLEENNIALVVLSKIPLGSAAKLRVVIRNQWRLGAMSEYRFKLMASLQTQIIARHQLTKLHQPYKA